MTGKKILLTGAAGQLGQALRNCAPKDIKLFALSKRECNLCHKSHLAQIVNSLKPDLIINCAAYNNVDKAESETDKAFRVNAQALGDLAEIVKRHGIKLVTFSTDFVFDGNSYKAYTPESQPAPINVYGQSKLDGERLAASISGDSLLIIRTAWLYSGWGNNFAKTILQLLREESEVRVVDDQYGSPTWATSLARTTWQLIKHGASGIYHFADSGEATWYEFACAIREEAIARKLVSSPAEIVPITSLESCRRARRPARTVLDSSKTAAVTALEPVNWKLCLSRFFAHELKCNF